MNIRPVDRYTVTITTEKGLVFTIEITPDGNGANIYKGRDCEHKNWVAYVRAEKVA